MIGEDSHLKDVFAQPPLTAFRRQNNLWDMLIQSKLPAPIPPITQGGKWKEWEPVVKFAQPALMLLKWRQSQLARKQNGRFKKKWTVIHFIASTWYIAPNCNQRYMGQTGRLLKFCIADRRGFNQNKVTSKITGAHWNQPGNSMADMKFTVLFRQNGRASWGRVCY